MRSKVVIVLALVFGLLAAFMVYTYLNSAKQAIENQAYTQVVTAAVDIPANTTITDTMVVLNRFPTELLTQREILDVKDAVGKLSDVALVKGEILLNNRLVKPGESTAKLAYKVPNGMRAMSVAVNEVNGVANLMKIGDKVDIIAVIPVTTTSPEPRAGVILQNIEIIAIGSSISEKAVAAGEKPATYSTVTLALDPQSALRLKMAVQNTAYSFTLRSAGDKNLANVVPITMNQL